MLDLLLKVLDKVKELLELRDKRQEKVFEKLIEPVYNEMQLVHQDYVEMLHQLAGLLSTGTESEDVAAKCKKALEFLEPRSLKLEALRAKLRAHSSLVFDDVKLQKDVSSFLEALIDYLDGGPLPKLTTAGRRSRYARWVSLLRNLTHGEVIEDDLHIVQIYALEMLEETKASWKNFSEVFAEIRVRSVSH